MHFSYSYIKINKNLVLVGPMKDRIYRQQSREATLYIFKYYYNYNQNQMRDIIKYIKNTTTGYLMISLRYLEFVQKLYKLNSIYIIIEFVVVLLYRYRFSIYIVFLAIIQINDDVSVDAYIYLHACVCLFFYAMKFLMMIYL